MPVHRNEPPVSPTNVSFATDFAKFAAGALVAATHATSTLHDAEAPMPVAFMTGALSERRPAPSTSACDTRGTCSTSASSATSGSALISIVAVSPASTGDQYTRSRATSLAANGPNARASAAVPANRNARPDGAPSSASATRSAAAPGDAISMRALRPPPASGVQSSAASGMSRAAGGSSRP